MTTVNECFLIFRLQGIFKANALKRKMSQLTTTLVSEIQETDDDFHDAFKLLFQENKFFDVDDISETMQMLFAEPESSIHCNARVEKISTLQSVTTTLISPILYHVAARYIVQQEPETDNIRNVVAEEGRGDSND